MMFKNDWIMSFDQEKMEQRCVFISGILETVLFLPFLWVDINRGM